MLQHGVARQCRRRQEIAWRAMIRAGVFGYGRMHRDVIRGNLVRFEAQGEDGASPGPVADRIQVSRKRALVSGNRVESKPGKAAAFAKREPLEKRIYKRLQQFDKGDDKADLNARLDEHHSEEFSAEIGDFEVEILIGNQIRGNRIKRIE